LPAPALAAGDLETGSNPSASAARRPPPTSTIKRVLPTAHLVPFLVTVYVLIVIPGPSVLFVVSRGVALGRRAALATVLGNTTGLLLQLTLVVAGLGSILAISQAVFTTLKLIGALYLIVLGVRAIRERKALAGALSPAATAPRRTAKILREGFIVGATNPKGLIIFTAILPTFIDRSRGHETLQLATLGLICALIAVLSDGTWALASGTARAWLGRSPKRLERLSAGGGVTLIALGVWLALTGRRT
jgi:threonine/homoserine/homoserine lactone efflux protein